MGFIMLIANTDKEMPILTFSKPLLIAIRDKLGSEESVIALHREIGSPMDFEVRFIREKKRGQKWKARSNALSVEWECTSSNGAFGCYRSVSCLCATGWTRQEAANRFFQQLFVPGLYFINQERSPLKKDETPTTNLFVRKGGWRQPDAVLKGAWL